MKRVVITGLGVVTPVGKSVPEMWDSLLAGISGAGPITYFDASQFPTRIAAEIKDFDPTKRIDQRLVRKLDRFQQYALFAAKEAMEDSGLLDNNPYNPDKFGIYVGSGMGGLITIENMYQRYLEKGPKRITPFFIPMSIINEAGGIISIEFDLRGPCFSHVSACSTGAHSIGEATLAIRYGRMQAALAGGVEATITPLGVGGFCSMRALTRRNDEPHRASRPFDKDRDGFLIGEGAGVVVLEELESAKARGAKIYGEVIGYWANGDAYHITAPEPEGRGAAMCMKRAIEDAGIQPEMIDYINAHGTSTQLNDKIETKAIKSVFGKQKAEELVINSTKSMIGHTLGAAGAIEFIVTTLTLKNGVAHRTLNLENPDPECDLNYCQGGNIEGSFEYGMSNSFGFGGTNACLIIKRFSN